jgi:hypothetical protein
MSIREILIQTALSLSKPDSPPIINNVWAQIPVEQQTEDAWLVYVLLSETRQHSGMNEKQFILARLHGLTYAEWRAYVLRKYPTAELTLDTGKGETYGEAGSTTAHIGPDMQADVVGVYVPAGVEEATDADYTPSRPAGFCWIGQEEQCEYPVRTE